MCAAGRFGAQVTTTTISQNQFACAGRRVQQAGLAEKVTLLRRDYRDLDDSLEIGTRNIALALRKLRRFARTGAADELDLDETISGTARNAGLLDLKLRPERHNAVKLLLLLDVGGSMDDHVRTVEELFVNLQRLLLLLQSLELDG